VSQIEQSAVSNRLLASLPSTDFKRLAASLTPVTLSLKQFLVEAGEPIGAAYFIETGIISYLNYLEGGEALEPVRRRGVPAGADQDATLR
jgi:CRP-like cAMP-binding protein